MSLKGKIKINFIMISVALITSVSAYSQVKVLTLPQAISLANVNNSDLVIARYDLLSAQEKVSQIYRENLTPTVTLTSKYTRYFSKPTVNILGQQISTLTDNSIYNTFDVIQPIPFLGIPVGAALTIADNYTKLSEANIRAREISLSTAVKKSFYTALLYKEQIGVNQAGLVNAQENLRVVEARYRNGAETEFNYLRARVRVSTLVPNVKTSLDNFVIAKKNLKTTIGLKNNDDIDVVGNLLYDSTEVFNSSRSVIDKMVEDNIRIKTLRINKVINEETVKVDKAGYFPKLSLFGQYSSQANENDGKSVTNYNFNNVLNAGVSMSWNLNFFRNDPKVHQSQIEVLKTDEQIADTKYKIKTQAETVLIRIEDARARIQAQYENVKLTERSVELANINFKSGVISQIDVLDANYSLDQARLSYIQAVYDYINARAELEELLEK
ncbi:TolC family protein [soil metagenome]